MYGNSYENVLVAVVVPDKKALERWASENGAGGASFEELCNNPKARQLLSGQLSYQSPQAAPLLAVRPLGCCLSEPS